MELQTTGILRGHRGCVASVCAASTGEILTASEDGSLRLWDLRTHRSVRAIFVEGAAGEQIDGASLGSCAFLNPMEPAGSVLAAVGPVLFAYDLRASDRVLMRGPPNQSIPAAEDINDFAVASNGSMIALPTDAGEIEILSSVDFQIVRTLSSGHQNIVGCARFRGEGDELFTGGFDERLVLWNPLNGKRRCVLESREIVPPEEVEGGNTTTQIVNPPFVLGLAVSTEESLAVGFGDGSLAVFPFDRGRPPRGAAPWRVQSAHAASADSVCWLASTASSSRSSPMLASAGRDCVLRLWSVEMSSRSAPRKQSKTKSAAVSTSQETDDTIKPIASVGLREKPNGLATASEGCVVVADTSCELSVFCVRG